MNEFFIVYMKTKTGKNIYLMTNGVDNFEWTFKKQDAIFFSTEKEAKNFCKNYFKNFTKWKITTAVAIL